MNKQISRLAVVALLLLAALIAATTYWQSWASPGLAATQDNAIQRVAEFKIKRGLIFASDGNLVLATNRKVKAGAADVLLPPLSDERAGVSGGRLLDTGKIARRRRASAERLPDRVEREPRHDHRQDHRQAARDDRTGEQPRPTIRPNAQKLAESASQG